jgi:hypothetical protein
MRDDDAILDQLSAGQREYVADLCAIAGLRTGDWAALPLKSDVEILALTRLADRLMRDSRSRRRSEPRWWKLAAERLGLTDYEAQMIRNNRDARRKRAGDFLTHFSTQTERPSVAECCPGSLRAEASYREAAASVTSHRRPPPGS